MSLCVVVAALLSQTIIVQFHNATQHDNVLWPHWEKEKHSLKKTIFIPELVAS